MRPLAWANSARPALLSGHDIVIMALSICFPVIGLDQVLRTAPAQISAQPGILIEHWLTDSLMAVPLFAAGIWAGDRIASRAGLGTERPWDALKRALVISLFIPLALMPVWFEFNKTDNPVTAQPLVFPHAQDSGDVYSVAPWMIVALVCVCVTPAASWAAVRVSRAISGRASTRNCASLARAATAVLLVGAVPVLAWLLHRAAAHAYASQVYYSGAATVSAAPFAFAYQLAHALQDALAGQAAGVPVAAIALLRGVHRPDSQPTYRRQTPEGGVE